MIGSIVEIINSIIIIIIIQRGVCKYIIDSEVDLLYFKASPL